jgi:hypothetical protein
MIPVTLTTVTGSTKGMNFDTKEDVESFITTFSASLPVGTAVHVQAPLVGITGGWMHGTSKN